MSTIALQPGGVPGGSKNPGATVRDKDRLGLTLFVALTLHALAILGISFKAVEDIAEPVLNMEVTLVHQHAKEAPDDAEYLAQANQLGGGNVAEKVRASSPFSNPQPTTEDGFAPDSPAELTPPPSEQEEVQTEVMTAPQARRKIDTEEHRDATPEQPKQLTAAQLFERSREIARLEAEINRIKQTYQQTPRHTYVKGANAREYRYAAYLDAWRAKVERIGRLNWPEEAVRRNLSGNLQLDVAINSDGNLHSVRILRPSGYKVLDKAALRIVKLASPYPPLPSEITQETDILHIPWIWRFKNGALETSVR